MKSIKKIVVIILSIVASILGGFMVILGFVIFGSTQILTQEQVAGINVIALGMAYLALGFTLSEKAI